MTAIAIAASIDAIAVRVKTITGILECYTVTGTAEDDGQLFPIPPSIDSTPVANVWFRGTSRVLPGNEERVTWTVDVNVWERGVNGGYGYRTLMPFADRFIEKFRTNLTLDGLVTKCQLGAVGEIVPQEVNGQIYLVLPVRLDLINVYHSSDYSAT